MAFIVKDRVRETSTSLGTGTITLGGAVPGFQSFSVIGNGNTTYYAIIDPANETWEVGIGTYTSSGTTLSRDTVLESSNNGAPVSFQTGLKDVFCTYPAERSVYVSSGSIVPATAATLPVVSGGTGASTASTARTNLGLGSIATQNANSVAITGGSITGITDLAIADGGTGASDASTARTNLGLGTIATQAANNVAITGGSITGITDLAIADGGTGASDAATALTNLGAYPASNPSGYTTNTGTVTSVGVTAGTGISVSGSPITTSGSITVTNSAPMTYPGAGVAVSTGSAWGTSKATPTGDIVGTTDTQTLTNKTITNLTFDGNYTEEVFTITDGASVDLNPANGTIQLWTLGANRTPTATSFAAGQSMTLMIDDGTAYAVTWSTISVVWVGGSAPTLPTSGYGVIELWKISTTVYGAYVGAVA